MKDENQEAVVELLLMTDCVDMNNADIGGRTALSWAAEEGNYTRAKLLLAKDDSGRDNKDNHGRTPFSRAAARGHDAIMTLLFVKEGFDPNSRDRYGQTPLHLAAGNGQEAAVKSLLADNAVDFESKDNFGRTPLTWAAKKGHIVVVELLREKHKDRGILIYDDYLDNPASPVTDKRCRISCNICLSWIPDNKAHYHCGICSRGHFDLCQECFAYGAFCIDQSHQLMKRMVEGGGFVEVSD